MPDAAEPISKPVRAAACRRLAGAGGKSTEMLNCLESRPAALLP